MKRRTALVAVGSLALGACVAGPPAEIATPSPTLPETYLFTPDEATGGSLVNLLPGNDPAFTALASQALAASPTLGEAMARLEQARAAADGARAERMPDIGANASVTGTRTNPAQFSSSLPPGIAIDTERVAYGANLMARWDPDIFGRLRAQERAALARVDAADASAAAVRIALLSEIAASVIDSRTLDAREAAIRKDVAAAESLARLSLVRERAGIAPGFDRVRAESAAATSRSRLVALESERARIVGRLVTLTAVGGSDVRSALSPFAAPETLPAPPPTLPSALLLNRPDIVSAAANLRAEDADLAAAARRRFPSFGLSGAVGLLAYGLGNLFDTGSLVGSLGATIAGPLLDFGRIEAEIAGAEASKKAAFEAYRGTVYTALGDAEAAYGLVAAADREAAAAADEASSLGRAAALAETRQRSGLADFLTVLEARRAADASGERAAAALGRARRARVLLWQALGGGPVPAS